MSVTVYLGAGSNLGDRMANLRAAAHLLATAGCFDATVWSDIYETRPVGGPASQRKHFNAAVMARTSSSPHQILSCLKRIETRIGRTDTGRWGPRVIDLDLLLYGELVVDSDDLVVPHPRMTRRRFVLVPLADLAGEAKHPPRGRTIRQILAGLPEDQTILRRLGPITKDPGGNIGPDIAGGPVSGESAPPSL